MGSCKAREAVQHCKFESRDHGIGSHISRRGTNAQRTNVFSNENSFWLSSGQSFQKATSKIRHNRIPIADRRAAVRLRAWCSFMELLLFGTIICLLTGAEGKSKHDLMAPHIRNEVNGHRSTSALSGVPWTSTLAGLQEQGCTE